MKKLILLLFIPLVFGCSSDEDSTNCILGVPFDDFICFDDLSIAEIESGVDGVYKDQNTGELIKNVVEEYYQICENEVALYKDGEEVGYADSLTLYSNKDPWNDDGSYRGYIREMEDEYVDTDIDYDDIEILDENESERYSDFKHSSDRFNTLTIHWKDPKP